MLEQKDKIKQNKQTNKQTNKQKINAQCSFCDPNIKFRAVAAIKNDCVNRNVLRTGFKPVL